MAILACEIMRAYIIIRISALYRAFLYHQSWRLIIHYAMICVISSPPQAAHIFAKYYDNWWLDRNMTISITNIGRHILQQSTCSRWVKYDTNMCRQMLYFFLWLLCVSSHNFSGAAVILIENIFTMPISRSEIYHCHTLLPLARGMTTLIFQLLSSLSTRSALFWRDAWRRNYFRRLLIHAICNCLATFHFASILNYQFRVSLESTARRLLSFASLLVFALRRNIAGIEFHLSWGFNEQARSSDLSV